MTKKKRSTQEVFNLLKERKTTIYLSENDTYLTLTTLVHEFGHIWGLCDQYPIDGNQTNCDPYHSTLSAQGHVILEEDAAMSSSNWKNELGLHDDDILGIIDLAERGDLAQTGWKAPAKKLYEFPEREVSPKALKFLSLKSVSMANPNMITIDSSIDSKGPFSLIVQMKYKDQESFKTNGPKFRFEKDVNNRTMKLQINGSNFDKLESLRVKYIDETHSPHENVEIEDEQNLSNTIFQK